MAGHRDDGTFAEDKRHHPSRKVGRSYIGPRVVQALTENLGINEGQAIDLAFAHRAGRIEDVYGGSGWDDDPEMVDLQNKVTKKGSIKDAISDALHEHRMNMKHGYGWQINPEDSWRLRG